MFCCLHIKYVSYIYTQKALWFTHVSFSDKTIRLGVWTCGQRAPTRTPLPHPHLHTHLPTSRFVVEQNNEPFRGNPSAASSSVVASSAANSSSVEADGSARQPRVRIRWMRVSRRKQFCNLQTRRKPRSARKIQ